MKYIYIYIYIYITAGRAGEARPLGSAACVRPISVLRLRPNLDAKRLNSHVHREYPGNCESTNLSGDNLSREIGRASIPCSPPPPPLSLSFFSYNPSFSLSLSLLLASPPSPLPAGSDRVPSLI